MVLEAHADRKAATLANTPIGITVLRKDALTNSTIRFIRPGDQPMSTGKGGWVVEDPKGTLYYHPPQGFIGTDTFTYQLADAAAIYKPVTVSITVSEKPGEALEAFDDSEDISTSDKTVLLRVLDNDKGPGNGTTLEILDFTQGLKGSVSLLRAGDGRNPGERDVLVYSPGPKACGKDIVRYTIGTQQRPGANATAKVTIYNKRC